MNDVGNFWFQMNLHVLEGIVFKVEHMLSYVDWIWHSSNVLLSLETFQHLSLCINLILKQI